MADLGGYELGKVHQSDCLVGMAALPDACIDAIVTDPPYGLSFMGRDWDHGVPSARFWISPLRVSKPGTHLLAFGGTRTFHRLSCAIEDAGWEIRDCLSWLYGQGFPKHRGALKPAWEPIILARKPLCGTVAANVQAHGTGAINVDGCRIDGVPRTTHADGNRVTSIASSGLLAGKQPHGPTAAPSGRWPANLVLDEESARLLDEMSGELSSGVLNHNTSRQRRSGFALTGGEWPGDHGGASRFFYCAKASRSERGEGNRHPTVKPLALMRWLCRLVTPPGGIILDPFSGSGTTGCAAHAEGFRFLGFDREAEYVEIANKRIASAVQEPECRQLNIAAQG